MVVLFWVAWRFWAVPRGFDQAYAEGLDAYTAGDMELAVERLLEVYDVDPDDAGINTLLGWSHWRLGRLPEAERFFERAYQADSDELEALQGLSTVRLALGKTEETIPLLEQAVEERPRETAAFNALADAYRKVGRNIHAARLYREAALARPGKLRGRNDSPRDVRVRTPRARRRLHPAPTPITTGDGSSPSGL